MPGRLGYIEFREKEGDTSGKQKYSLHSCFFMVRRIYRNLSLARCRLTSFGGDACQGLSAALSRKGNVKKPNMPQLAILPRSILSQCLSLVLLFSAPATLSAQTLIPLYAEGHVPNSIPVTVLNDTLMVRNRSNDGDTMLVLPRTLMPTLRVFQPAASKNTGTAVIICSGGSYRFVLDHSEGIPAARTLAAEGITAFVLHYRVPRSDLMIHKEIVPAQDLQKAIQYVRENAAEYHIDPASIGVMGFSAAGHLVSTVATHPKEIFIENPKATNLRPDFMILAYPVISFADSLTHWESRENLIGPEISAEKIHEYSNELQVSSETPPAFIAHAIDDDIVKVENSLYFAAALQQSQVSVKLFLYAKGGHAFGIFNRQAYVQWINTCMEWIKTRQWAPK
jgi:acetyl esterase/lipase